MSSRFTAKLQIAIGELASIRDGMSPLIQKSTESEADVIQTAAAAYMLHSVYTEVEKCSNESHWSATDTFQMRLRGIKNC